MDSEIAGAIIGAIIGAVLQPFVAQWLEKWEKTRTSMREQSADTYPQAPPKESDAHGKSQRAWTVLAAFAGAIIGVIAVATLGPSVWEWLSDNLVETNEQLPSGYVMYDDFSSGDFGDRWSLNDPDNLCSIQQAGGILSFACVNPGSDDRLAALDSRTLYRQAQGLAARVAVQLTGGPLQFTTSWLRPDTGIAERAYHLELDTDTLAVVEYYPRDNWRKVILAEIPIRPSESHWLRIERYGGDIAFVADGDTIELTQSPDWTDEFVLVDWGFSFFVWPQYTLQGNIEAVAVKHTE